MYMALTGKHPIELYEIYLEVAKQDSELARLIKEKMSDLLNNTKGNLSEYVSKRIVRPKLGFSNSFHEKFLSKIL